MITSEGFVVRVLCADDWDRCDNLYDLSTYFGNPGREPTPGDQRKFRLLVVAAIRAAWPHVESGVLRNATDAAERFADDPDPAALQVARAAAAHRLRSVSPWLPPEQPVPDLLTMFAVVMNATAETVTTAYNPRWLSILASLSSAIPCCSQEQANAFHLQLFRDVIPNPYRRVGFDPDWRPDTVMALARHVYDSRDFTTMPILADALQEAGCDDEELLGHCRDEKRGHVRGCWALDRVLGKD